MEYHLGKTYIYAGQERVKLLSIWADSDELYGACKRLDRGAGTTLIVRLKQLSLTTTRIKRVSLSIRLVDNDIEVQFRQHEPPVEEQPFWMQTSFDVRVEDNAEV
jgi:hypothetical protein